MLSDRERQTLVAIERQLVESDPELARIFAGGAPRRGRRGLPRVLLICGVLLMVIGSMIVTVSVAITGIALSILALCLAHARPAGLGRSSSA